MDGMTMEVSESNNKKCLMDKLKGEIYSSLPKVNENNGGGDGDGGGGGGDAAVMPDSHANVTATAANGVTDAHKDGSTNDADTTTTNTTTTTVAAVPAGECTLTMVKEQNLSKDFLNDDTNAVTAASGLKQQHAAQNRSGTNLSRSSTYQCPTDGSSGAGDAPYLGPLGGAMVNNANSTSTNSVNPENIDDPASGNNVNNQNNTNAATYNMSALARFLPVQALREIHFDENLGASNAAAAADGATAAAVQIPPAMQMNDQTRKQLFERHFRQVEMGCPAGYDCYSRKVFVGGLPPDIDETAIQKTFRHFGPHIVDWPHKNEMNSPYPPKGFVFLLFYDDTGVRRLIDACAKENGHLFISVSSHTMKDKPAEVRPWRLADADYIQDMNMTLDPRKTVFIGGVPRPIKAYELAMIMDRLFGRVCYAGIDTDPDMKYPKGAGRVTFFSHHSYVAAISARFVQLQHQHIDKRVEIKPYVLDDQQCDECKGKRCSFKYARFFCSNTTCLRYYCDVCWTLIHARPGREYHKPLIKEYGDRPRAVPYCWHFIDKN